MFSRGLIVSTVDTEECNAYDIVALPFSKFHNWSPFTDYSPVYDNPVAVEEKVDGTLLIVFLHNGEIKVATKAGMDTDFAKSGRVALMKYLDTVQLSESELRYYPNAVEAFKRDLRFHTFLFEYTSPENRVVIDYGRGEDLTLLTVFYNLYNLVDFEAGYNEDNVDFISGGGEEARYMIENLKNTYSFKTPKLYELKDMTTNNIANFANTLNNVEGFVLRFSNGNRLKVKTEEYLALHRSKSVVISLKSVAKYIMDGNLDVLIESAPDEAYNEIKHYELCICSAVVKFRQELLGKYKDVYWAYQPSDNARQDRANFALYLSQYPERYTHFEKACFFKMYQSHKSGTPIYKLHGEIGITIITNHLIETEGIST